MPTLPVVHVSVSIQRPVQAVYEFISNPLNLPKWASGLSGSITKTDGKWMAGSPMGKVEIQFAAPNELGVVDHTVTTESGEKFYNPMRVFPNTEGSEVLFSLFHVAGSSDEKFLEDIKWVENDLQKLKILLEGAG